MRPGTRDHIIYLVVGLGLAGFQLVDTLYHLYRGTQMWIPSKFVIRAVYTSLLLEYFVIRTVRKMKLPLYFVAACALLAAAVHLLFVFRFHDSMGQLAGIPFCGLAVFKMFLIVVLTKRLAHCEAENSLKQAESSTVTPELPS